MFSVFANKFKLKLLNLHVIRFITSHFKELYLLHFLWLHLLCQIFEHI